MRYTLTTTPKGPKLEESIIKLKRFAYSLDKGRNWTKYEGNPVLNNPGTKDFRDPKVIWHEQTGRWVVILAVGDHISLYTSPNLIDWTFASDFGVDQGTHDGVWECPDLFELPVDNSGESKWVLILNLNRGNPNGGSGTQYFVGQFDGNTFTNDNSPETVLWLEYGRDNYAGVTWSDIPSSDGRRLFIGWMSNWEYANLVPTVPWRNAMTVPRTLNLTQTANGVRLANLPVKELQGLRQQDQKLEQQSITEAIDLTQKVPFSTTTSELILEFDSWSENADFGIRLFNPMGEEVLVGFDAGLKSFYVDRSRSGKSEFSDKFLGRHTAPRESEDGGITMHILVDVSSVELFADNGQIVMTDVFFPNQDFDRVELYARNGQVNLKSGSVFDIGSIW